MKVKSKKILKTLFKVFKLKEKKEGYPSFIANKKMEALTQGKNK
jgi:hypothetical protein